MPPFGNESEEAVPKKLSYLSFGSAAKPPRSCPSPSLFGAEPDESAGRAGVRGCKPSSNTNVSKIRLPFQDEDEDNFGKGPSSRPKPKDPCPGLLPLVQSRKNQQNLILGRVVMGMLMNQSSKGSQKLCFPWDGMRWWISTEQLRSRIRRTSQ